MSLSFLLTSLIVVVSPGTGVLYTLAVALTPGIAGQRRRRVRLHARDRPAYRRPPCSAWPRCCIPARWRSRR